MIVECMVICALVGDVAGSKLYMGPLPVTCTAGISLISTTDACSYDHWDLTQREAFIRPGCAQRAAMLCNQEN